MSRKQGAVAVVVVAGGVPTVLVCAYVGAVAGALVDVLASGFDGPTVFPTALRPWTQGALIAGALGFAMVVAVARRALRPFPRFGSAPSGEV